MVEFGALHSLFLLTLSVTLFAVVGCDDGTPPPPCTDVCAHLTSICADVTAAECAPLCEGYDRGIRQCILNARTCSTAMGSCLEEGMCGDTILDRGEECDDGNTVGGDGCSASCTREDGFDAGIDGCAPGETLCDGMCADLMTSSQYCGSCETFCELDEDCIAGVCEPERALEFVLEWDVPGNLDLHVLRPDGEEIWWSRTTPPTGPDGLDGMLDRDDTNLGPERVVFDMPTPGAYHVCVNARAITETTEWTMSVLRRSSLERVVQREARESNASFNCTPEVANLEYNLL